MRSALAYLLALAAGCSGSTHDGNGAPDLAVPVEDLAPGCSPAFCAGSARPICDPRSGYCVGCLTDDDCAPGWLCGGRDCVPGCTATHVCPDGGGTCDVASKSCKRCGSDGDCGGFNPRCDLATGHCVPCLPLNDNCPSGHFCEFVNGSYLCDPGCLNSNACPSSDGGAFTGQCCNKFCVTVDRDLHNCGSCGHVCGGGQAQWQCAASSCVITGCDPGFADCDHNPGNGCEADLTSDGKNCGSCGLACGDGGACAGAKCG